MVKKLICIYIDNNGKLQIVFHCDPSAICPDGWQQIRCAAERLMEEYKNKLN